ncbi:hypothetical protein [Roseibium sp. MMSF_3412]|uniref:hypothetical protein n=1 Tax=Roseibium sp. MMSF_3412 TaxID=3046712 RepID=UPI00273D8C7A|nr:hypothetical protein [Roseibium sp. MMSF_3412]
MEPVVTLEGAKRLSDTSVEHRKLTGEPGDWPDAALPADGRSVLCTAVDRDTILLAGVGEKFARNLQAVLNEDPKTTVPCTIVSLSAKTNRDGAQAPFVAILSLDAVAVPKLDRVSIRSKGHSHPYAIKYGPVAFDIFVGLVSEAVSQKEASVVETLIDALIAANSEVKNQTVAAKLVMHVARRDGYVEMLGQFDEGDFYIQGWSKEPPLGRNRVFVFDGALRVADLASCLFERKDTGGKAPGFAGILDKVDGVRAPAIRSLFFRGRSGWTKVDVHERGTVSPARALPGHLRALLPRLNASGGAREKLERASQRFGGRETVSELDVPVRIGVDFCAATNCGSVLISGWLLNPEDHAEAVYLRAGERSSRLDRTWTTQNRPDVTATFEDLSPFLGETTGRDRHGFLAFVPDIGGQLDDKPYLEVVLRDGRSAYAPIALGRTSLRSALRRLVAGLDPTIASATDIIERQFLPLLGAVSLCEPTVEEVTDMGPMPETPSTSIVIGSDGSIDKLRTLLPVLALDPFLKGTPIVICAAATAIDEQFQEIARLGSFYGLALRIVRAGKVEDALDAIQAGMHAAPSDTVVCLGSGVVPLVPGWLDTLVAEYRKHEEGCLVTPTVLYEDDTIRWAGTWIDRDGEACVLKQHYVGYPRRTLMGAEASEVVAATFDCCVVSKTAFLASGGFARNYLGTDEKGLDATLKLRIAGVKSFWVPEVEMVHPEDGQGSERLWHKLVGQHDREQFAHLWSGRLGALKEGLQ